MRLSQLHTVFLRVRRGQRVIIITALITLIGSGLFGAFRALETWNRIPDLYRSNLFHAYTSGWGKDYAHKTFPEYLKPTSPPSYFTELLEAKWMGDFSTPALRKPDSCATKDSTPALLMIHVFSGAMAKARPRRDLIRKYSPLNQVPERLRHLVELKFVVGHAIDDPEVERSIDEEEREFGDLIRLDDLLNGENMDDGKTIRWARWVGRPGGREAQWVFKCDDDTMIVLPNFLPFLLKQDPSKPHNIGTTMQRNDGIPYYMNGFLYGFSWGVIKTLASANLPSEIMDRHYWEDAGMGLFMFSLPSKPGQPKDPLEQEWRNDAPISPDPRTGLIRIDTAERMTDWTMWWGAPWYRAYAWHRMKTEPEFLEAHRLMENGFVDAGRKYEWKPPSSFRKYELRC